MTHRAFYFLAVLSLLFAAACSEAGDSSNQPSSGSDPCDTSDPTDVTDPTDSSSDDPSDVSTPTDTDGDGIADEVDPCPESALNLDTDGDGLCDEEDPCPEDENGTVDTDGDGFCDGDDDCPEDAGGATDSNGDGLCNQEDDSDGDGISDAEEFVYGDDCGISNPYAADSDLDGIGDMDDPYPRDPWTEFILYRNDEGTIDLMLSNRDGTFEDPVEVGLQYGGTDQETYRYVQFAISDFDDNGRMDFLALADPDPSDDDFTYDVWWFWRTKSDELEQRLVGQTDLVPFATIADLDNDELVDLVGLDVDRPNFINSIVQYFYANQRNIDTATCFATDNPDNLEGCAFVVREAVDVTPWASGQWSYRQSKDAVDVDGDGNRDIAILRISSGGNSANVPITVLYGRGDGTFELPSEPLFTHNSSVCGASPANVILFGDFDLDNVGDIITGLDDDGDAGSAWFYPGVSESGTYDVNTEMCYEAFDINPVHESGGEHPGVGSSAQNFDFDFDGKQDVMVGFNYASAWAPPSKTVIFFGQGDGSFGPPVLVRDYPNSNYANSFAVPRRVCARFPVN